MLFFAIVVVFITVVYLYLLHSFSYWKRRNIPYDEDYTIPFGCLWEVFQFKKNMGREIYERYLKSEKPYEGLYLLYRPALLVRDVEIIRHIMVQNFTSFHDRGIYVDEKSDPLSVNLLSLRGKSWKNMRTKLTPLFTSGKLKNMFCTSADVSNKMIDHLNSLIPKGETVEVDIAEVTVTYAIDIIASVIFGLDIDSFKEPNNDFRNYIRFVQRTTYFNGILNVLGFLAPQ